MEDGHVHGSDISGVGESKTNQGIEKGYLSIFISEDLGNTKITKCGPSFVYPFGQVRRNFVFEIGRWLSARIFAQLIFKVQYLLLFLLHGFAQLNVCSYIFISYLVAEEEQLKCVVLL